MTVEADETRWLDATTQAELVASGRVSPTELVRAKEAGLVASRDNSNRPCPGQTVIPPE